MSVDLTWDWLRWVNVAAAVLVVVLLVSSTIARWDLMPYRLRRIMPWLIGTYGTIAYGSGEVAAQPNDVPPGIRVALLTLTLFGLIIALLTGRTDGYERPTGPGFFAPKER